MRGVRAVRGDCLVEMATVKSRSVQMILTDLPYGATDCAWDRRIPMAPLWREFARVMAPHAACALFAQYPFLAELVRSAPRDWRIYDWIWDKVSCTGHANAKRMPLRQHEAVLIFYPRFERPLYFPQGLVPTHRIRRAPRGSEVYHGGLDKPSVQRFTGYPKSIVRMERGNKLKPAEKPVKLLEMLIRTYTRPGDTVLDATMGLGSTGVAAVRCGRKFIGFEIDPERFEVAQKRIAAEGLQ